MELLVWVIYNGGGVVPTDAEPMNVPFNFQMDHQKKKCISLMFLLFAGLCFLIYALAVASFPIEIIAIIFFGILILICLLFNGRRWMVFDLSNDNIYLASGNFFNICFTKIAIGKLSDLSKIDAYTTASGTGGDMTLTFKDKTFFSSAMRQVDIKGTVTNIDNWLRSHIPNHKIVIHFSQPSNEKGKKILPSQIDKRNQNVQAQNLTAYNNASMQNQMIPNNNNNNTSNNDNNAPGEADIVLGEANVVLGEANVAPGETYIAPGETYVAPGEVYITPTTTTNPNTITNY